jgi:lipopolysaccharide biosynthesis glycosyltransferase
MRVAILSDENYVMGLGAAIRSLLDNSSCRSETEVAVFSVGLSEDSKSRLVKSWDVADDQVMFCEVDEDLLAGLQGREYISPAPYGRLFLDELLPAHWDRVLFTEPDVIVRSDLRELYEIDLRGHPLAAVQEPYSPTVSSIRGSAAREEINAAPDAPIRGWREEGLPADTPYFNAAMMVIDLECWRERQIGALALRYAVEHQGQTGQLEEECLNAVLGGDWLRLDPRWAVSPYWRKPERRVGEFRDVWTDARAWHFQGPAKPWLRGSEQIDGVEEFFAALDKTMWTGWRPTRPVAV